MQPDHSAPPAIIREMRPEDRTAVIRILIDSDPWKRLGFTAADWNKIFSPLPQGRDTFVIEAQHGVLGIAIVRQKFLFGDYLELLGIAPSVTGQGLGQRLLSHIESLTFARATNLFACVSDFNDGARAFYRKQGYKEIGPMPNFLIPGYAEILLRKTAGPARER
ncbi:MAG: putative N-acetyltransferase, GCN5-related [Nitrospira sp.]|jgi:ribosomal-protein-alanine N-acetyltransferase|nr:putative N-acetyltransferase, GCN5-related [Nitrospira sp.]